MAGGSKNKERQAECQREINQYQIWYIQSSVTVSILVGL